MFTVILIILLIYITYCIISRGWVSSLHSINNEALSKKNTTTINGLFIFLVFLSHFCDYVHFSNLDKPYMLFSRVLGQCIVASFLFYSGYGIGINIKNNRAFYLDKLITKRFFSVLSKFALCVLLYHLLNLIEKKSFPSMRFFLLTLIGYESAGNSNWYIFYILIAYLLIFVSFKFTKNNIVSFSILFFLLLGYTIIIALLNPNREWYFNTAFVIFFGMLWAFKKESIDSLLAAHWFASFVSVFLFYVIVCIFYLLTKPHLAFYNFIAIAFALLLVVTTYKIQIKSPILYLFGENLFWIYILQRLPMIFFYGYDFPKVIYFLV